MDWDSNEVEMWDKLSVLAIEIREAMQNGYGESSVKALIKNYEEHENERRRIEKDNKAKK